MYKRYKNKHPICEKCGGTNGIEVHHKIPLIKGGNDTQDNLISLCYECHKNEHKLNRSELTRIGIEKARNALVVDVLISKIDLLREIHDGELTDPIEIIDCIVNAQPRKFIRVK